MDSLLLGRNTRAERSDDPLFRARRWAKRHPREYLALLVASHPEEIREFFPLAPPNLEPIQETDVLHRQLYPTEAGVESTWMVENSQGVYKMHVSHRGGLIPLKKFLTRHWLQRVCTEENSEIS